MKTKHINSEQELREKVERIFAPQEIVTDDNLAIFCWSGDQEVKMIDNIMQLIQSEREKVLEKVKEKIEWEVGTVLYTNPKDNSKHKVYNADHIQKILAKLAQKEKSPCIHFN